MSFFGNGVGECMMVALGFVRKSSGSVGNLMFEWISRVGKCRKILRGKIL